MRAIDDLVVDCFGLTLVQMMENAGRSLAQLVTDQYRAGSVTVLVGPGHNGGGGLVAARHLFNRGVDVVVVLARSEGLAPTTTDQLRIVKAMGIPLLEDPPDSSLVIDALVGYSLEGEPHGRVAQLIEWTHQQSSPVVSLDVPSGLDATSGRVSALCVRAHSTLTLALVKNGILVAPQITGELFLADISIPRLAYQQFGLDVPNLFSESSVLQLFADVDDLAGRVQPT